MHDLEILVLLKFFWLVKNIQINLIAHFNALLQEKDFISWLVICS